MRSNSNVVGEIISRSFTVAYATLLFILKGVFCDPVHVCMIGVAMLATLLVIFFLNRTPKTTLGAVKNFYARATPEDVARVKATNGNGFCTFWCKHCTSVAVCAAARGMVPQTCVAHHADGDVKVIGCKVMQCRRRRALGGHCVAHQGLP